MRIPFLRPTISHVRLYDCIDEKPPEMKPPLKLEW